MAPPRSPQKAPKSDAKLLSAGKNQQSTHLICRHFPSFSFLEPDSNLGKGESIGVDEFLQTTIFKLRHAVPQSVLIF
jgi:hypothetical protein